MSAQTQNNFKFYGVLNGKQYFGYTLYCIERSYYNGNIQLLKVDASNAYSYDFEELLTPRKIVNLCDATFKPKQGDPVYLSPDCILARDDVRKRYSIKRSFDAGVCNVVSGIKSFASGRCMQNMWFDLFYVYPGNVIVATTDTVKKALKTDIDAWIKRATNIDYNASAQLVQCRTGVYWRTLDLPEVYENLLMHTNKTPIIHDSMLPMDGGTPLTMDTINILEKAALRQNTSGRGESLVLALQAVNQCNWREYTGTLSRVWSNLCQSANYASEYRFLQNHRSILPKAATALSNFLFNASYNTPFKSDEDYSMGLAWSNAKIGLENGQLFVPLEVLEKRLVDVCFSKAVFLSMYDNVMRIRPKNYAAQ